MLGISTAPCQAPDQPVVTPLRPATCTGHRFLLIYGMLLAIAAYQPAAAFLLELAPRFPAVHALILTGLGLTLLPIVFLPWGTGGLFARPIITVPLMADPESPAPVLLKAAAPAQADALHAADTVAHEKVINPQLHDGDNRQLAGAGMPSPPLCTGVLHESRAVRSMLGLRQCS